VSAQCQLSGHFSSYLQTEAGVPTMDRFTPHSVCAPFLSLRKLSCSLVITASLFLLVTALKPLKSDIPPKNFILQDGRGFLGQLEKQKPAVRSGISSTRIWIWHVQTDLHCQKVFTHFPLTLMHC